MAEGAAWPGPPVSYVAMGENSSPRVCEAFARGCGGAVAVDRTLRPGAVALFGSPKLWELLREARAEGRDWYYADHAYFRRLEFYRFTRNAWQHDGRGHADPEILRRLGVTIRPWRRSGGHVLVCPPDRAFAALMGFDAKAWKTETLAVLARHTDRCLRLRERRAANSDVPLADDLADCWALVTYMSNAAVEAVCAGVPVFCSGPCAARRMGGADPAEIETPPMPDGREQWAANLAANQWTLDEIASGACWRAIGR